MNKLLKIFKRPSPEELSRSRRSVESTDLTEDAVRWCMDCPDEIEYDTAWEKFKQHNENEHGTIENAPFLSKNESSNSERVVPNLCDSERQEEDVTFVNGDTMEMRQKIVPDETSGKEKKRKEENETAPKKLSKMAQARQTLKITLLVGVWVFFTIAFLMHNDKVEVTRHSSVAPGQIKDYLIQNNDNKLSVLLKMSGPFLSEQYEKKLNSKEKMNMTKMEIWLEEWIVQRDVQDIEGIQGYNSVQISHRWTIILENQAEDFHESETRSSVLQLRPLTTNHSVLENQAEDFHESETRSSVLQLPPLTTNHSVLCVRMTTTSSVTTPFTLNYTVDPLDGTTGIIYACILLCALYALIIFEVINRTMAAVLLSTASLAVLAIAGERPSLPELISWLDVETLMLLFSMMLLVEILKKTGVFDYFAVWTFQLAKGKIWPLITLLLAITAIVSLLLDNVTTVLVMTPITIRLCEVMELDPIPVLLSMVLFCNLGGTATPVGDPPNVIIASNKQVVQAGINFPNFTLHMSFGILLVAIQTYFQLRFIFRDVNKLKLHESKDVQDLRRQISIWRRAADSLPHLSGDQLIVKQQLEKKIDKLTVQLHVLVKEDRARTCSKASFKATLADMRKEFKIKDKVLLIKCTVAIFFVVIVFFLHSIPEFNRVSLGWTALLGALLLLTLADLDDLKPLLKDIEWSTLLFFAALFVLMEALSKLGLIGYIGGWTEALILKVDESNRLAVALVLMVWVSGITSAFVDNVPLTTMMVRVVTSLGTHPTLNLPMAPLVWALSFGVCLGGNGTLIGASSNVICVELADKDGYKISFMQFFKIGFPVMIGHLVVATGYLLGVPPQPDPCLRMAASSGSSVGHRC